MNKKSGSGSSLFLMEMIVVVLFFTLCASTCILIFVKANSMSQLAKDTNQGVVMSESIVETLKAEGTEGLINRLGAVEQSTGIYVACWDNSWKKVTNQESAVYTATVTVAQEDSMMKAHISLTKGEKELYGLDVSKYVKQ